MPGTYNGKCLPTRPSWFVKERFVRIMSSRPQAAPSQIQPETQTPEIKVETNEHSRGLK
jgi:hypothetical protein